MRGVLWCNGGSPPGSVVEAVLRGGAPIFGVDGGADKAREYGANVESVLGDLDSVDRSQWEGRMHELPEQSSSDLTKSIEHLVGLGFDEIDVLGIGGGSPDHLLGAWASLAEAPPNCVLRLHHGNRVSHRVSPDSGELVRIVPAGQEFSVFALEACDVSISGAKWQVDREEMVLSTRGLHNQGTGEEVRISADGVLVVIFPVDGYSG